ncbi:MAG: hypothetical protein ABIR96_07660 [Bdellovibrionota bacterium]
MRTLFASLVLTAAMTATAATPEKPLYEGLSLGDLEKLEYDRPDDANLKMALAQQYWCEGDRGLAVEHWRWLLNLRNNLEKDAETKLRQALKTPSELSSLCLPLSSAKHSP